MLEIVVKYFFRQTLDNPSRAERLGFAVNRPQSDGLKRKYLMSSINSLQRTHIKDAPTQYFDTTWRNRLLCRHDCSVSTEEKILKNQARTEGKWKVTNSGRTILYFKPIECECEFCFRLNWRPAILSSNIPQSESAFRNRILASGKTTNSSTLSWACVRSVVSEFRFVLNFCYFIICNFVNKYLCDRILLRKDLVTDWRLDLHVKVTHVMSGM